MILFRHTMSSRKPVIALLFPVVFSVLLSLSPGLYRTARASSDPEIKISGRAVKFKAAPYVSDSGELFAPLDFITAMGAKYQLASDRRSVAITLANDHASSFSCEESDGQPFVPVAAVAQELGGIYRWDDDNQTATILAKILMVREDSDHLSVATSFPVSCKVDAVDKPSRVYIDVNGAWLGSSAATIPVSGDDVAAVRSNQISRDRVRVVVDLKRSMPFHIASAAGTNFVDVALDPGTEGVSHSSTLLARANLAVAHAGSTPVRLVSANSGGDGDDNSSDDSASDSNSGDDSSTTDTDTTDGSSLTRSNAIQHISNIQYDASKPGILSIIVTATGPGAKLAAPYKAFLLDSPMRLALDLPGADITLPASLTRSSADSLPIVNAMVKTIRWGVLKPNTPLVSRVVLDLYKSVSYTVATTDTADSRKYVISVIMPGSNVVPLQIPQMATNPNGVTPQPIITQPDATQPGEVLNGKTIVVDAGHGGHDSGAPGVDGLYEKNLNLSLAKEVRDQLVACGVRVIMTRADDTFIPLPDRAQMGIDNHADMFLSIHCDSCGARNAYEGATVYYHANLPNCHNMASAIASRLGQLGDGIRDLGTRSDYVRFPGVGFSVLRHSPEPSVLVEAGYVNSDKDAGILTNPNMQRLIAQGIVAGIKDYVTHEPASDPVAVSRSGGSPSMLGLTQTHSERSRYHS